MHQRRRRELPIEVGENILMRLPVEHVLRCKLLSKTYYDLIKSTIFVYNHHRYRSKNVIHEVCDLTSGDNSIASLESNESLYVPVVVPACLKLLGSCNGLLCAEIWENNYTNRVLVLWNPATREHRLIPPPRLVPNSLGFGYDATTDDYKLVRIYYPYDIKYSCYAQIWSAKVNIWKKVEVSESMWLSMPTADDPIDEFGTFVRGKLYWFAPISDKPIKSCGIVVFDVINERFCKQIALPDNVSEGLVDCVPSKTSVITDFMGSLAFLTRLGSNSSSIESSTFGVWVLKMDGDDDNSNSSSYSWEKYFSIVRDHVWPTRICMNGKFLFRDVSDGKDGTVFYWYDPHREEPKEFWCAHETFPLLCGFSESLVSLNQMTLH